MTKAKATAGIGRAHGGFADRAALAPLGPLGPVTGVRRHDCQNCRTTASEDPRPKTTPLVPFWFQLEPTGGFFWRFVSSGSARRTCVIAGALLIESLAVARIRTADHFITSTPRRLWMVAVRGAYRPVQANFGRFAPERFAVGAGWSVATLLPVQRTTDVPRSRSTSRPRTREGRQCDLCEGARARLGTAKFGLGDAPSHII
jgi:hypothetical protein